MRLGRRYLPKQLEGPLRRAVLGPTFSNWQPATWLMPHQVQAAQRIHGSLVAFGGALLADAVGLGKTYVALALVHAYRTAAALVPAATLPQWAQASNRTHADLVLLSHDALSRGRQPPPVDLLIVDEAHHFRNPKTRRYDTLARSVRSSDVLLLSATPVVNRAFDLVALFRLFSPDHAFAPLGVASLENAGVSKTYRDLTWATAPAVVARSGSMLPHVSDLLPLVKNRATIRPPPVPFTELNRILEAIDSLEFPAVGDDRGSSLMRMHLLYRLASSAAACRETARRHLAYTGRALDSIAVGRPLDRALARRIFATEDELQLDLGDLTESGPIAPDTAQSLRGERERLAELLRLLPTSNGKGPKATELVRQIEQRPGHKTIVFTSAVATAHDLARILGWRHVAVVAGGKAWVTSGRLAVEEVLGLFAPRARGAPEPGPAKHVTTLIATDLASEGLDLQDADSVIHYDLPWTPLRLEQRVGRVARLGSQHEAAEVSWFAPAEAIEERLHLESRITGKVICQLALGVATTSGVGKAQVINRLLCERERLGRDIPTPSEETCHAVVRGPLAAAIAVRWSINGVGVPELVVIHDRPLRQERDYATMSRVLERLLRGADVAIDPPRDLVACFLAIIRSRLAASHHGPTDAASRRLARTIVRWACRDAPLRDDRAMSVLNVTLDHIAGGLAVGPQRVLEEELSRQPSVDSLTQWARGQGDRDEHAAAGPEVVAALFGDGSVG